MSETEISRNYIRELGLVPHPEGGWFKVVHVSDDKISSPYIDEKANRGVYMHQKT
jgi:predicted cupin superfamily sugar epimerase